MKEKINKVLLSGACLFNIVCASGDQQEFPEGANSQSVDREVVRASENDPRMPEVISTFQGIRKGILPQNIIEVFKGLTKIDISQQRDHDAMRQTDSALSKELMDRVNNDEMIFWLNVALKVLVTPIKPGARYVPLAQEFFGLMEKDIKVPDFYRMICRTYNFLFANDRGWPNVHIQTPVDWATIQFISFFFNNAIGHLGFVVDAAEVDNPEMVSQIIMGLDGASSVSILGLEKLSQDDQEVIFAKLAEVRPKNTQVILGLSNIYQLERSLNSLVKTGAAHIDTLRKIAVSLVVDFAQPPIHGTLQIQKLIRVLNQRHDVVVPAVWDLMLKLKSLQIPAVGHLIPILKAVAQSPLSANLSLPNLTADHETTNYVMTRLREEFLTAQSKVRLLDFEGSQLSDDGWEQLALLAESGKPFFKIRLTGMKIPPSIAVRLGALRVQGINMAGCRVSADILKNMVAGWLDGEVTLKGVDLCGNVVSPEIAGMFIAAGFEGYLQDKKKPYGYMFAKP